MFIPGSVLENIVTEWAIMVPFDEDYIYVTELKEGMDFDTTEVKTFATREEAEREAEVWQVPGKESLVKVVEYDPNA